MMSLKAFHIFFIGASVALAIGYGVWEINGYLANGMSSHLMYGVLSCLSAVALVVYGIRFLKKLKHVRML